MPENHGRPLSPAKGRTGRSAPRAHLGGLLVLTAILCAEAVGAQDASAGGSQAPCAVPLHWRVTRVDPEFGLDIAGATEVVREAAAIWMTGWRNRLDEPLFVHDETDGFPIRLVYDERQEQNDERLRRQRDLDVQRRALDATGADLSLRAERHGTATAAHADRVRDLESRAAMHNATVRSWNERGGAPPGTRTDLESAGDALDRERSELMAAGRALDEEADSLRSAQQRLDRDVAAYNRRVDQVNRDFPSVAVRSGEYREAVQRVGGRVVGISREIRIYRFASLQELRLIASHELGHALGVGHAPDADAVMSEEHDTGVHPEGIAALTAADEALLLSRCPALAPEGR
ncbi:MAG: matrixin family metalloprotease [Gemmatimonadales bacterium]